MPDLVTPRPTAADLPGTDARIADEATGTAPPLRRAIAASCRQDEATAVQALMGEARLSPEQAGAAHDLACRLATHLRERGAGAGRSGLVQGLLQEYALSSQEGVALMCLAEALLRIPDAGTRDALIRDKIAQGEWQAHLGRSPSLFVNAATWGLLLTGRLVATHSETRLSAQLGRLVAKGGEPLIRKGVDLAMRMMGEQFVTGQTIAEALTKARPLEAQGFRHSYDMLGEAAMTAEDAARYRRSYEEAIHAIGRASAGRGPIDGPGISIKLSALHPRYSRAQKARVMDELYAVLRDLATLARQHDIGLNIDAEEADRLELSLDLLERLCFEPALAGWNGLGFVVQAYQKRCPFVIDFLIDLAARSSRRLMVRLVKGAYWDSEIKRAQVDGQDGFPVYTRKVHTDVAYLACARRLLAAPAQVYPQFATHNAHTLAAIHTLADPARWQPGQYEFQCLHGMGEPLYEQVVGRAEDGRLGRPCRIYAPVGTHETLLAYLVRRLLENGANTSFVHRIADRLLPIEELVEDPVATVDRQAAEEGRAGAPHPAIAHPLRLYGEARANSQGMDLADDAQLAVLEAAVAESRHLPWSSAPVLGTAHDGAGAGAAPADTTAAPTLGSAIAGAMAEASPGTLTAIPVRNPACHADIVGTVRPATAHDVAAALAAADSFAVPWAATPAAERATALERAADRMQARMPQLVALLSHEAGKTFANGIAEVREAIDFLRFYAGQARRALPGDDHAPLGPVVCISPWNFPLAIFTGQIAAALAAGNPVLAKPAEQTPLLAAEAVRLLHESGIPRAALQLLPGDGETVGAALVADPRVQGVMFTGSTEVARLLQRSLAQRLGAHGGPVPLIAETGGQNAMIVDSSALTEQVVADVLASAFDSAGQRCSALRVLCVQEESADALLHMLRGAMAELNLGDPAQLPTDVGPVIDAEARAGIEAHVQAMQARGRRVHRAGRARPGATEGGTFVPPTLIEIDSLAELQREVFGPVLHVLRWRRPELDALLAQIAATGYGLTLGLHTRIDETIERVVQSAHVGNVYVNRNMVGAVVGVQPFGGESLSGTGPKAGGPLYLYRLLARRPKGFLAGAVACALPSAKADSVAGPDEAPLIALKEWARGAGDTSLVDHCDRLLQALPPITAWLLDGPTGERNRYGLHPRAAALCLAEHDRSRLAQLAAVLAAGSRAVWPGSASTTSLHARLPADVQARVSLAADPLGVDTPPVELVLHEGDTAQRLAVAGRLAERPGSIVGLHPWPAAEADTALAALLGERSLSVNTAAAGGNASLMTMA
ncbi:trifunctional transcriptional regulator/proline dehydrogenase/L-glutamate gamma-semialdehyde dehydrogenase [Pseudacidovorax intermedius]|uniref:trifunctional transcriptional regulator/proline dehydrogenase/L-glutamate gamma-semialdehyde dehydrogenase n=1 Tax=Pseudacidovorax intermedius TaxID=433924 RepID=UPI0026EBE319|nr:trifunctional transcriptional regulator/proline dehydrogenase/L-glutamate gamma-semialdehyde dehydrogenase [Pseudacidovorax intermedius]